MQDLEIACLFSKTNVLVFLFLVLLFEACQLLVSYLYSGVVDETIANRIVEKSERTLFDLIDFTNNEELKLGRLNYLLIMYLMEKVVSPYKALTLLNLAQEYVIIMISCC